MSGAPRRVSARQARVPALRRLLLILTPTAPAPRPPRPARSPAPHARRRHPPPDRSRTEFPDLLHRAAGFHRPGIGNLSRRLEIGRAAAEWTRINDGVHAGAQDGASCWDGVSGRRRQQPELCVEGLLAPVAGLTFETLKALTSGRPALVQKPTPFGTPRWSK